MYVNSTQSSRKKHKVTPLESVNIFVEWKMLTLQLSFPSGDPWNLDIRIRSLSKCNLDNDI